MAIFQSFDIFNPFMIVVAERELRGVRCMTSAQVRGLFCSIATFCSLIVIAS